MGKTIICGLIIRTYKDYPRLRGKDQKNWLALPCWSGSPPLTRERLVVAKKKKDTLGITPAYAGTTLTPELACVLLGDHPRLRGKDFAAVSAFITDMGSPPLTRERRINQVFISKPLRITPAHAGKTYFF